ncbi:hypothetical protein SEPCBS57363_005283 [Sporothrix epigloea]|uniref:Uncharacterized protein n=1 Tax=Sporothrix epigloea TaxID=1892477 RepID=A0ABP0E0L9_9PEZI
MSCINSPPVYHQSQHCSPIAQHQPTADFNTANHGCSSPLPMNHSIIMDKTASIPAYTAAAPVQSPLPRPASVHAQAPLPAAQPAPPTAPVPVDLPAASPPPLLRMAYLPVPCCSPVCKINHTGWALTSSLTGPEMESFDMTKLLFDRYEALFQQLAAVDAELRACRSPQTPIRPNFARKPQNGHKVTPAAVPVVTATPVSAAAAVAVELAAAQSKQAQALFANSQPATAACTQQNNPRPRPAAVTKPGAPAKAYGPRHNEIKPSHHKTADRTGAGRGAIVRPERRETAARSLENKEERERILKEAGEEYLRMYTMMLHATDDENIREQKALVYRSRLQLEVARIEREFRLAKELGFMPWMD